MKHSTYKILHKYARKMAALALTGALAVMSAAAASPLEAYADWDRTGGYYRMPDGTVIENVVARGIDVSHWKQNIDWSAVAADDIQFVMLGTRYAGDVDPYFRTNAVNAANAGLRVGAYIYSYATTPEMAVQEADFVLDLIKDYPISFPVAFDAEDSVQSALSPGELSAVINAFCGRIEAAGYHPMVYANDYWLANKIDMSQVKYDVWVARYGVRHSYNEPIMWQATNTGSVRGVNGNVDIDFLYRDLSPVLPANLWRTIGGRTYYYQNYTMQRDTWIDDGTGWYYMDSEGLASKGWLEQGGAKYYLSETDGRMATGWKQFDNGWHYFAGNGAMATGWITVDGLTYHLNPDGIMNTGWLEDQGRHYYLKEDGSMATGWRQLGDSWYYFNPAGEMARGWIQPDGTWYYLEPDGRMKTGWLNENNVHYYLSTTSGKMTVGWRSIDDSWYYFNASGAMATGLTEVNGLYYYLNPADGKMAANTTLTLDGVDYSVDANGVCTRVEAPPQTEMEAQPQGPEGASGQGSQTPQPDTPSMIGPGANL